MTQKERALILVGTFREQAVQSAIDAALSVGVATAFVARCNDMPATLAQTPEPLAILLQMNAEGAAQTCAHIRGQPHLAQLPILGIAAQRDDLAFTELFSWGGDDLLALDSPTSLLRRLRPLASRPHGGREPKRECALVAGSDARWRGVMGRALYQGGFSVRFVASSEDLSQECLADGVRVVVCTDDFGPDGARTALTAARGHLSHAPWIVVVPPKRMGALHASMSSLGPVAVADGFAPPENVLFLTNELRSQRGVDQRATPRVLYGTNIAFGAAGREQDEVGFSYNVSAGGVYVRTLAPLDAGQELWLEMWSPRSERRVRLAGTVAWRRPFGPTEGATVPAGFGVKITDGLAGDLERWRDGYGMFADSIGMRAAPVSGTSTS
ncbi:MAG: PilZ domain-containing protein [Myxococcota bacterium]|nr:PilZ domain-containing protein [Myxococcota bacterium]